MSFNTSTEGVLLTVNSAIDIILFIVIIPTTILHGICVAALLFAKDINAY